MTTSLITGTLLACMTCVLTACGTEEDKALPGDSDIVEGADGAAGAPDALDCSMNDGTCPEPCRAGWARRYDRDLDCLASERVAGSSGSMLYACLNPGTPLAQALQCVCNSEGGCGLSGMIFLPLHDEFSLCDGATYAAVVEASSAGQECPPGHFE